MGASRKPDLQHHEPAHDEPAFVCCACALRWPLAAMSSERNRCVNCRRKKRRAAPHAARKQGPLQTLPGVQRMLGAPGWAVAVRAFGPGVRVGVITQRRGETSTSLSAASARRFAAMILEEADAAERAAGASPPARPRPLRAKKRRPSTRPSTWLQRQEALALAQSAQTQREVKNATVQGVLAEFASPLDGTDPVR